MSLSVLCYKYFYIVGELMNDMEYLVLDTSLEGHQKEFTSKSYRLLDYVNWHHLIFVNFSLHYKSSFFDTQIIYYYIQMK